ncbi:MAG: kelch repeat-containing protein [Opitutaceae bacterium]
MKFLYHSLLFSMSLCANAASSASVAIPKPTIPPWKLFAPLPDSVGFAGMVAGVLNGRLVVAGGSQFPKLPNWLKGEKTFSDRIFTLDGLDSEWKINPGRLPFKVANAVTAVADDKIFFAGGLDATGCLVQVWTMQAQGDGFVFTRLPDLPEPIGYGAGVITGGRFYVAAGLNAADSKMPSVHVWSLDLNIGKQSRAWRREPDLPQPGVFVAAGAGVNGKFYVLGGIGFDSSGKAIPSKRAYVLDSTAGKWERLPDLPSARIGVSSPCPVVDQRIWAIGGYSAVFPGEPREHPGFDAQTLAFDLTRRVWQNGPVLPTTPVANRDSPGDTGPSPMIGAPCVIWNNYAVVIGGEVRASVRTTAVLGWPITESFVSPP